MKHLIIVLWMFVVQGASAQFWTQIGQDLFGNSTDDEIGWAVSINGGGDVVAIGTGTNATAGNGTGYVKVYERVGTDWIQIGSDIVGESENSFSGNAISLNWDGNIIAIGAFRNDGVAFSAGHVRVFENVNGNWVQLGSDIDGEDINDLFGSSVSLNASGTILAVRASQSGTVGKKGKSYVFQYVNGNWTLIGDVIEGEGDQDGHDFAERSITSISISCDGNTMATGALANDGNGENSGHVRVYENVGGNWQQVGSDIDGEAAFDNSGSSVSMSCDGQVVAIGSPKNADNGTDSGQVRVYQDVNGEWEQMGQDLNGDAEGDNFGHCVSLSADANVLAVGAFFNDETGLNAGQAKIYVYENGSWTQAGETLLGISAGNWYGHGLDLNEDGNNVIISAPLNNIYGFQTGLVRVYDGEILSTSNLTFEDDGFVVSPNPVGESIILQSNKSIFVENISVVDINGRVLKQVSFDNTQSLWGINASYLSAGVYFIVIRSLEQIITKKVVKSH